MRWRCIFIRYTRSVARFDAGDPLRGENRRVMGTIKLYEAKNRPVQLN